MSELRLFSLRVGLNGVVKIILTVNGIILFPLLTKNLTLPDYGAWVLFQTTVMLLTGFTVLGLDLWLLVEIPSSTKERQSEIFWGSLVFLAAFSLILALIFDRVSLLIPSSYVGLIERFYPMILAQSTIYLVLSFYVSVGKVKKYSISQTALSFIDLICVFLFAKVGVLSIIDGIITMRLLLLGVMLADVFMMFPITVNPLKYIFSEYLRKGLRYGLPLTLGRKTAAIVDSGDRYFIQFYLGPSYVGLYNPGYALGGIIYTVISPLESVFTSAVAKLRSDETELRKLLTLADKYITGLGVPAAIGISLISKPLLTVLSTQEIASVSFMITPFVAASMLLSMSTIISGQAYFLERKTVTLSSFPLIAAIANTGLNFVIIPKYGLLGAALTTLISYALIFILTVYFAPHIFPKYFRYTYLIKVLISSTVMALVVYSLMIIPYFRTFVGLIELIVAAAFVYLGCLTLLRGFTVQELRELLKRI
jgi:O-antigen/teichoic acid export membrane protein